MIWNLNDLKLFREFKSLEHKLNFLPSLTIDADLKRLTAFTIDGDLVIFDFTKNLRKKIFKTFIIY